VFDIVRGYMVCHKLKSVEYAVKGTVRNIDIRTEEGALVGEVIIFPISDVTGTTRIKIGFWDWEANGQPWALLNGFATLPNERQIFESLANYLISTIQRVVDESESPKEDKTIALQARWNKMADKTKENFQKAWNIWKRMQKEYEKESLDGQTKKAQPQIKDWRTRVIKFWKVDTDRLRDVKEMGELKIIK
jgi:hypothetical protein